MAAPRMYSDELRSWGTFAKPTTRGRNHLHIHDHLAGDRSQPRLVESHVHITAAATAAGTKVLLVEDWAQLSPVRAGGAFKLLADAAGPGVATLHDVFRFRCEWERDAILRLRVSDETVGEEHVTHGRLESGARADMLDLLFEGWLTDQRAGRPSLMIAPDVDTVDELNSRAQAWRVRSGQVAQGGVRCAEPCA